MGVFSKIGFVSLAVLTGVTFTCIPLASPSYVSAQEADSAVMSDNNMQLDTSDNDIDKSVFDVINSGHINALVVRLGYKDYPLDDSNLFYKGENFFYNIFNGNPESGMSGNEPFYSVGSFIERSSFGKQSLSLKNVIDIQMDNDQSYYYPATDDYEIYSDIDEVEKIINSREFIEKLSEKVDFSEYDTNADGKIDALYVFDMAKDEGNVNRFRGFFSHNSDNDPHIYFTYIPGEVLTEYDVTEIVTHETGHMLWGLDDLYVWIGFMDLVSSNTVGNLMGNSNNEAGDIDGYSKYLIGWLTEENLIRLNRQDLKESDRVIRLNPSDANAIKGEMISLIDCGEGEKIAIEYVSGKNNNDSPMLDNDPYGFRFYHISDDKITEIYDDGNKNVFSENDEINNIFLSEIKITDIETGEMPGLRLSYGTDSVSKGLVKGKISNLFTFKTDDYQMYSDWFEYEKGKAAVIKRDNNGNGIICVYADNKISETHHVDLSGKWQDNKDVTVKVTSSDELVIMCSGPSESFILKTDKEGNSVSNEIVKLPGEIESSALAGTRLKCRVDEGVVSEVGIFDDVHYYDVDIANMTFAETDKELLGEIDRNSYYLYDYETNRIVISDEDNNNIAVLDDDINKHSVLMTKAGNGYISVERLPQNEKEELHMYEITKYDENGEVISADFLKEATALGSEEENNIFTDQSGSFYEFSEGKILSEGNKLIFSANMGVIIADLDTFEAEYIGNYAEEYNKYLYFDPVLYHNGKLIIRAHHEDLGSYLDPNSQAFYEITYPFIEESDNNDSEKSDNHLGENGIRSDDQSGEVHTGEDGRSGVGTDETNISEKNSEQNDKDKAYAEAAEGNEAKDVLSSASEAASAADKSVSAQVRNDVSGKPAARVSASASSVSKTVNATGTGVKDHMSAWTMAAAGSIAAAFGAAVVLIKRRRVDK